MSVAPKTLVQRTRRRVGDYPQRDALVTALSTTTATTLSVAANGLYVNGMHISLDEESMIVTGTTGTTGVTVIRGAYNTVAATHAVGAAILIEPAFSGADYLDGLNEGLRALWPNFFVWVEDTSLVAVNQQADYTLPTRLQDGKVLRVQILEAGAALDSWYEWRQFEIRRDQANGPIIHFTNVTPVAGASIKLIGIGRFDTDMAMADTQLPAGVIDAAGACLSLYAAYYVLTQAEARRDRARTANTIGPGAPPAQASAQLAYSYYQQFLSMKSMLGQSVPQFYTRRRG